MNTNMNANIKINVDSIADAFLVGGRRGGKMNTYNKVFSEWVDQWNKVSVTDHRITACNLYEPGKIIVNGPATIVFWEDGTKTVVKCAKGETWDIYNAFTAALAIKVFGSNSKIKKILKTKVEWPDDFTLAVKED